MAEQYRREPGNYLAFFSSYAYLEQVRDLFKNLHPDIPTSVQTRNMQEGERQAFLDRFTLHLEGIGFAVLGGAFGEGIDLPGKRLIGAFIVTLGLPQLNVVNAEIKARVQEMFGEANGYDYAYPGMQKVVQAAGRVIRTTDDRGVVYLLDDHFGRGQGEEPVAWVVGSEGLVGVRGWAPRMPRPTLISTMPNGCFNRLQFARDCYRPTAVFRGRKFTDHSVLSCRV